MIKKDQIVRELIRMDLINHKLINSLNAIAIEAEVYCLGIDGPIFELMGLQERPDVDDIYEQYNEKSKAIMTPNPKYEANKVEQLVMQLYEFLLEQG